MDNLFIDFYSETEASVRIQYPSVPPDVDLYISKRNIDALLFACFAIRQMSNLGNHPSTSALIYHLSLWFPLIPRSSEPVNSSTTRVQALKKHILYTSALEMGMGLNAVEKKYGAPVFLRPTSRQWKTAIHW